MLMSTSMPKSKQQRIDRPGMSLVELIVSMTGGAVVFCLAVGTLEQTMKLSKDGAARTEHQATLARLSQQFRNDVHASSEFQLTDQAIPELVLRRSQSPTVHYKVAGAIVTREELREGSNRAAREEYRLAESSSVSLAVDPDNRLELKIMRRTADGDIPEGHVVARLNRLTSLQQLEKEEQLDPSK